jgi:hypothetical protein
VIAPIGTWSFQGALLMTTDGTAGIDAQVARTGSPGFTLGQFSYPAKEA